MYIGFLLILIIKEYKECRNIQNNINRRHIALKQCSSTTTYFHNHNCKVYVNVVSYSSKIQSLTHV